MSIERISTSYFWLSRLNSPPKIETQLKRTVSAQPMIPVKNETSRARMIQTAKLEAIFDATILVPLLRA